MPFLNYTVPETLSSLSIRSQLLAEGPNRMATLPASPLNDFLMALPITSEDVLSINRHFTSYFQRSNANSPLVFSPVKIDILGC